MTGMLLLPAAGRAQVAWDAPLLLPPMPEPGLGIFLADTWRGGLGVIGMWRPAPSGWGLRFGIAEERGDGDIAALGGIDFVGRLNRATSDFPIDIDWVFGAGLGVGDNVLVSFPLGITGGHTFRGEGATFKPYVAPRVVLDAFFRDNERDDDSDLDLGFTLDLGIDLRLSRSTSGVLIRFGASLGDREAVGVGLVF
jgi:hypothetical protein